MKRVIQIAPSRNNRGGITTILKRWEASDFWKVYKCVWIETQDNRGIWFKIYYLIRSFFQAIFWVPQCGVVHFHTTPGRSIAVQMPIFLLSLLFNKKIIVQLHVGNQLNDYVDDKSFKWVLNKADKIVVLAYIWRDLFLRKFNIPKEKVEVIYNAAPDVRENCSKEPYVLFMAYLNKNKGYDVLIKAFSQVAKDYPEWKLVIAGAGEIENAKELAKQSGVDDKIEIKGWIEGDNRDDLLKHAGAYCMASYQEGFPMTVLEAWSYGIPLVTTPVGGLPDVLKNGENALVFDFGDVEGLRNCLIKLMSSLELRGTLSDASRKMSKEKFSIESITKDIIILYDSL